MTELFERIAALEFQWRDAVDILIVAIILYNILRLLRGTRAMQMMIGLMFLGVTFFVARALDLLALETLTREILFYTPFAIIVLFQHEIRRVLASVGRNRLFRLFSHRSTVSDIDVIVRAATELGRQRTGALIVMEGTHSLRALIETGHALDSVVSYELLLNIFVPNSPLHDGAVVIQGNRIAAAGVFLPLSASGEIPADYGTRHRAAVGVTEESDAFVVVVSEENGAVGAAVDGTLHQQLTPAQLVQMIQAHLKQNGANSQ